ncbi:serine protease Do [Carnobacterium iners]|uniref:Serine protease Do n=1 Tax=Carnobacterium iners TaxID=1073423 RepID=A0A1X7MRZ3_9LACT|nr:trypsin-like peptidase domain-containing protein [Carnobacterium iners]SEK75088.1 serine protease Do [Carnobacterium iners]SMH27394.1 serine protease Do [Carnobacterium iners]
MKQKADHVKEVTPKKNKGFKAIILGGLLGGLIVALLGGGYLYATDNLDGGGIPTQESGLVDGNGKVTTTDVTVNVTSEVTEAVKKVEDSVVSVINMKEQNLEGFDGVFGSGTTEPTNETNLQTIGEGSGVIYKIDGDTAYIVTNNHVIDNSDAIEILLKDGTKFKAEVIGTDIWTDLAVLSVPADKVKKAATFGNSDSIQVGEPAIAIGSPLGTNFASSVTQGIVSAKNRTVDTDIDGDSVVDWEMTVIQTDAAINPGNSGGALINIAGQVIGINSMKISADTVEGLGFAIPSNDVVDIINQLETEGKVVRPVLGISLLDISQISEQQKESVLKLPKEVTAGVVVGQVQEGSAAEKGGLQKYDVIVKFNGEEVKNTISLRKGIYKSELGKEVEIDYYRDGKLEKTTVTMTTSESIS